MIVGLARVSSVAVVGVDTHVIDVEVDISNGLPYFAIVGLPDAALDEAKNRVRSALTNSGLGFPMSRIVANLSPATLRKTGSGFDLAIAVALLVAQGVVDASVVDGVVFLGELSLDGRLRPTLGVLPAVLGARAAGVRRVVVPLANLAEAELVAEIDVVGAASLSSVAAKCGAHVTVSELEPILATKRAESPNDYSDLADVVGQVDAVRALVVAAAGRHHMLAVGPPGAGKSLLASRLPGILPDLSDDEALQVTAIRSLVTAGTITELVRRPPLEAPHHSATVPSIVGGGSGTIRPGAASLASGGVLFIDEAAEFPRTVLDALRQSLESGQIVIHRATGSAHFPARFQLVMASNPCPCGMDGVVGADCTCAPSVRRRYLARLSGPLLDRVDIQLRVARVSSSALLGASGPADGMSTRTAQDLVVSARAAAAKRLAGTEWRVNAEVAGPHLRGSLRLAPHARAALDRSLERGAISMRGYDRVLRLAWTCADLAGRQTPTSEDVGEALFLRQVVSSS